MTSSPSLPPSAGDDASAALDNSTDRPDPDQGDAVGSTNDSVGPTSGAVRPTSGAAAPAVGRVLASADSAPRPAGPWRLWVFTGAVLVAAIVTVVIGGLTAVEPSGFEGISAEARFAIVALLLGAAQLARLRLRIGAGTVSFTWGEAALIVGLHLIPAGWLPAAAAIGVGIAWTLLSIFSDRRTVAEVARVTGSLTVAVAVASVVTSTVADPYGQRITPVVAVAAIGGALAYLLLTAALATVALTLRHERPFGATLVHALRTKLLMFVGNVLVGLVAVAMIGADPRWLLLLPPALWLLQQTYGQRLRAQDEQRAWQEFAEVTRALNKLDEYAVAQAAVNGGLTLFGAERVEVDVQRVDGRRWRYVGDATGAWHHAEIAEAVEPTPEPGPTAAVTDDDSGYDQILVRPLSVESAEVGQLRVHLPAAVVPGRRDRDALAAFGETLAVALHDAATHRELRRLTAWTAHQSMHDPVTKLLNRPALLAKGDTALHQLGHDHPVALLMLDIKRFNEVNDTLGTAAGDELLQSAADRLTAGLRPGELLGRLGNDEFALLLTSLTASDGEPDTRLSPTGTAMRRAGEIADTLAEPTEVAGVRMSVEGAVGVVVAGAGTADMNELLRRATIAMNQAKEIGGSVAGYDSAKDAASTDQLALLAELRTALDVDDQLELALQPAVDLTTGAPTGVEALIRWRHPRRGRLTPIDFVRAVESSDLLGPFTRYVVDRALSAAAEWAEHGIEVPISVNVSARSLLDPQLPAEIGELLRQHAVPAHRLVLEITETVVMSELEVIDEVLARLREMGVQLAVDDFGTGFSSLAFLTRVTVDELKVDRSFVVRMADSPRDAAIVRHTVYLGREMGLRVVAEGVETAEQRATLAALGCAAAQGYHFFKPMPADKIIAVLRSLLDSAQAQIYPLRADGAS
ncbi:GGDEF domain-containing phosphodiesterase [Solwaraspora sp. WMMD406]|uniref:putative bifunctional diguanylate cyclase/phosphodiesterase n=1 Tax=Solwaraspora sp. WMMD406 TaxID=3016095 RepID=UPI002415D95E|nr:GGDEF domain-containing phosphodiesterase [Solwaraspora sp. WMMD406]MDG4763857.1 GGDEF domain-containing phosphodiesterase [Solwaraspora sp. WMMD406]